jgi:hypothetical protein
VPVSGGLTFSRLALGAAHTCGLTPAGLAYCWGFNQFGQIGDGSNADKLVPTPVNGGHTFVRLVVGNDHSCGLDPGGHVFCWGDNEDGQVGDGTSMVMGRPLPVAAAAPTTFADIGIGFESTCGLSASGAASCWGFNGHGQLGDGSTTSKNFPSDVEGGLAFSLLSTKASETQCGLVGAQGYCWGLNDHGQVGDGTTTNRTSPTAIGGGLTFSAIHPGSAHSCALSAAGAIYCWGRNNLGQVGDGTSVDRLAPTVVALP